MPIALTPHLINAAQRSPLPVEYEGRSLTLRSTTFMTGSQRFDLEVADGDEVLGYIAPWDDFEYGAIAASKAGVTPALVRTLDAALVEILR
jgi:hypothetical protein